MLQDKTESDISWLGSVSIFMLYILAPLTGVLVDKIGPRASTFPCLPSFLAPYRPQGSIPMIIPSVIRSSESSKYDHS